MDHKRTMTDPTPTFFGHPKGLKTLFFTEMWERFSYYGMRAILILFMTTPLAKGGLGLGVADAGAIYGIYTSMVYLACLPGGWIADRFVGQRRATLVGGCIIMCGHIVLALPSVTYFYTGLALLVIGTGLLKPNISSMVGQLYSERDQRRDAGYSLYYMGINIGAFASPLVCGWLGQGVYFRELLSSAGINPVNAWHFSFGAAAVGMALGLLHYVYGRSTLVKIGDPPQGSSFSLRICVMISCVSLIAAWIYSVSNIRLSPSQFGNIFGLILLGTTITFFAWLLRSSWNIAEDRRRVMKILLLFLAATVFWSLFEQGGSTLTLFAERNTSRTIVGINFPASWMQSLNPLFIIFLLGPAFSWLWFKLGSKGPNTTTKFVIGLLLISMGYGVMIGAAIIADSGLLVSPLWLVVMYLLHTMGEMCLSPVGLSAMSKLAPQKIASLTMGIWFLASSIGSYAGGRVAGLYEAMPLAHIFMALTILGLVSTIVLSFSSKFIDTDTELSRQQQ